MSSFPTTINQVLNAYSDLISDVGREIALPGEPKVGWTNYSKLFCDNIILWALYNTKRDVNKQKKDTIATILLAMEDIDVDRSMVKILRQGNIYQDSFLERSVLKKYKKKRNVGSILDIGYFCIKVSLRIFKLVTLLGELEPIVDDLADNFVYLHDLDIATDCRHVTSRPILEKFLKDKYGKDVSIVKDLSRVGNHCLSWISETDGGQKTRCKVYNKLVQMLESAENVNSLGSRMESIVMPIDKRLHRRLRKAKMHGLTRLELTFYGTQLHDYSYYVECLDQVKEQIQDCTTYKVPFKKYWEYMTSNISSMIGVFVKNVTNGEEESAFAYCHWWNSITSKKYGSHRCNVDRDEAMTLLANYSFNDRPIYFLEYDLQDPGREIMVTKYLRPEGSTEMTLVAGRQKSLYPRRYRDDVYNFKSMGIKSSDNITIKWPKKRLQKSSPPLVDIYQVPLDDDDVMYIQVDRLVGNKSSYKPAHDVLTERTKYTVIAAIKDTFREREYIFAMLSIIKVRCGKSLERKITQWLNDHPIGQAPVLEFTTKKIKRIRGYTDIIVE